MSGRDAGEGIPASVKRLHTWVEKSDGSVSRDQNPNNQNSYQQHSVHCCGPLGASLNSEEDCDDALQVVPCGTERESREIEEVPSNMLLPVLRIQKQRKTLCLTRRHQVGLQRMKVQGEEQHEHSVLVLA